MIVHAASTPTSQTQLDHAHSTSVHVIYTNSYVFLSVYVHVLSTQIELHLNSFNEVPLWTSNIPCTQGVRSYHAHRYNVVHDKAHVTALNRFACAKYDRTHIVRLAQANAYASAEPSVVGVAGLATT